MYLLYRRLGYRGRCGSSCGRRKLRGSWLWLGTGHHWLRRFVLGLLWSKLLLQTSSNKWVFDLGRLKTYASYKSKSAKFEIPDSGKKAVTLNCFLKLLYLQIFSNMHHTQCSTPLKGDARYNGETACKVCNRWTEHKF